MARRRHDAVTEVITEVESLAKRLRVDLTKAASATGLDKRLRSAAKQLRKQAARAAAQVEKYVHQVRIDLQGSRRKGAPRTRRRRSVAA